MIDKSKPEDASMTHGFQHQDQAAHFTATRSAASPQHGQKCDEAVVKLKEKRSFEPRPGH